MSQSSEDRSPLRALARGDVNALGQLYDAHAERVYHLLLARGLDPPTAEDVVQEVFLSLLDRGSAVAKIENVAAYLLAVARNIAARRLRHGQARTPVLPETGQEGADDPVAEVAAREALRQLPPEQAEVVALKVWHELTFAEIGEALEIPPNTAASRYRYALEKLRELWGGMDDE